MQQTLTGLLCTLALFLIAWNEVPDGSGSLLILLGDWIHPALAIADARNAVRIVAGLMAVTGCFFCIAGMGNTLGLIPLFGGRVALSARLAGAVLGSLLALAAVVSGQYSSSIMAATLMVTPLALILLALLWLSRREQIHVVRRGGGGAGAAAPILIDLPDSKPLSAGPRQEPTVPAPPARSSQPASFTSRAPRAADGQTDLAPLEFDAGSRGAARGKSGAMQGPDLGLPPLEFTPRSPAAPIPQPSRPAPPVAAPARATPAAPPVPPVPPQRPTPLRIDDGLPPLDFPAATTPRRPAAGPTPAAAPAATPLTLDTLDFSPARRPTAAPLADELAQWNPRPASPPAPVPAPTQTTAPAPAKAPSRPVLPDLPDELPPGAQIFNLDTVAPREQGPRRALLDEEPDLLAQLGSLAQVPTPPSAPLAPAPMARAPEQPLRPARTTAAAPPPVLEPERVKLADKGVFSIYKLIDAGNVIGYALTEHGATVAVGTQEQVKQVLRERWPGAR